MEGEIPIKQFMDLQLFPSRACDVMMLVVHLKLLNVAGSKRRGGLLVEIVTLHSNQIICVDHKSMTQIR